MTRSYVAYGGPQLCGACSKAAADAYNMAHSGRWLFRDNPPIPRGYIKAVIPVSLRWAVFERDNFTCKHCGARQYLEADHVVPECKGGKTTFANLQTLCKPCNVKKGGRAE